jgi:NAD(P)-dependent dehydrogenase (short-subunit alcohol dehydrogenase family)
MTRGILIAGIESSLSAAVAEEAGKRVEQYATAIIPNKLAEAVRSSKSQSVQGSGLLPLMWNPGSPISARTLVMAAENRLGRIDQAILVCTPPPVRREAEELAPADIDTVVNDHIKGWFFLVKELAAAFSIRARNGSEEEKAGPAGTLALVLADTGIVSEKGEIPDLMGPSVAASFRSFAQGLLASSVGKPYQTLAFSSETGEDSLFASFIFKILDEGNKRSSAKWFKYGKFSFFGR